MEQGTVEFLRSLPLVSLVTRLQSLGDELHATTNPLPDVWEQYRMVDSIVSARLDGGFRAAARKMALSESDE